MGGVCRCLGAAGSGWSAGRAPPGPANAWPCTNPCSEAADPQPAEDGPDPAHDDNGVHEPPLDHGEAAGWGGGEDGAGVGRGALGSRSPALSAAIHAGAADPAAHQPGAERGEGSVGGREGKTSLCCCLKCSVPRGPAAGCPIPPARCDLGSFGLGASVLAPGEICAWEGTGEMGSGTLLLL